MPLSWFRAMGDMGSYRRRRAAQRAWSLVAVFPFVLGSERRQVIGDEIRKDEPLAPSGGGCSSRCLHINYEEEFDDLGEAPAMNAEDPRSKLKQIPIGDSWRLDFGGEFRLRWESRTNADFGQSERTQNAQQDYRWFLHANVKFRDWFRVFAQGAFNHVEDQDGPFQPTLENHGDLQQLFFDLRIPGKPPPWTLRVGRQELSYGAYRLVGPLDWVSNRRRFDGVKLVFHAEKWRVDAFYVRPVVVERHSADHSNEEYDFYGIYSTFQGIPRHEWDFYALGVNRTDDTFNPNGRTGDQSIYSLGTRFFGESGPWDYDTELTGQWGTWAGDTVQAWSWAIDGGYTFHEVAMRPRIGGGFDWTSGDDDPADGAVGTFDQLFPFDHRCNGMQDLVGRQNATRAYIGLDFWPVLEKIKASVAILGYWLSDQDDSLYNAGGVATLRDPSGRIGNEVGQELDIWIEWKLTSNSTLSLGYSHFWDGPYVHGRVAGDDDPDMYIVQYRYRF